MIDEIQLLGKNPLVRMSASWPFVGTYHTSTNQTTNKLFIDKMSGPSQVMCYAEPLIAGLLSHLSFIGPFHPTYSLIE